MSVKLRQPLDSGLLRVTAGLRQKERKKEGRKNGGRRENRQAVKYHKIIISLVQSTLFASPCLYVCVWQYALVNVHSLRAAPALLTISDKAWNPVAIWVEILSNLQLYMQILHLPNSLIQLSALAAAGLFLTNQFNKQEWTVFFYFLFGTSLLGCLSFPISPLWFTKPAAVYDHDHPTSHRVEVSAFRCCRWSWYLFRGVHLPLMT